MNPSSPNDEDLARQIRESDTRARARVRAHRQIAAEHIEEAIRGCLDAIGRVTDGEFRAQLKRLGYSDRDLRLHGLDRLRPVVKPRFTAVRAA